MNNENDGATRAAYRSGADGGGGKALQRHAGNGRRAHGPRGKHRQPKPALGGPTPSSMEPEAPGGSRRGRRRFQREPFSHSLEDGSRAGHLDPHVARSLDALDGSGSARGGRPRGRKGGRGKGKGRSWQGRRRGGAQEWMEPDGARYADGNPAHLPQMAVVPHSAMGFLPFGVVPTDANLAAAMAFAHGNFAGLPLPPPPPYCVLVCIDATKKESFHGDGDEEESAVGSPSAASSVASTASSASGSDAEDEDYADSSCPEEDARQRRVLDFLEATYRAAEEELAQHAERSKRKAMQKWLEAKSKSDKERQAP